MKKGGKAGTGVGKKKAGAGAKKAGTGLKQGERPLLSAAESLAIQSAVLPPEPPQAQPEESKAPIQPEASPSQEPIAVLAESSASPEAVESAASEATPVEEEGEGKAEDSLPPAQATGSDSPFESQDTVQPPTAEVMKSDLGEESPSQPQEAVEEVHSEEIKVEGKDLALEEMQGSYAVTEAVVVHAETPLGTSDLSCAFGEKASLDIGVEGEMEPEQPEIAPTEPPAFATPPTPVESASTEPPIQPSPLPVTSSVPTPLPDPRLLITAPAESPPRAASPVLPQRSKVHSKQPSREFAPSLAVSRMATETYESLDDFASKVDPPLKKFPTFQPDSSDMMSFDEFLTTIDESPKAAKSLRSSINVVVARKEEEMKPKFAPIQPSKMALKRVSVKTVDPEIDKMKQLAREKEAKRAVRVQAATKIQARIRGILARKRYSVLRKRHEKVKTRERLAQLREAIRVTWAPYRIYKALKVSTRQMWLERQKVKRAGVFVLFQQHCALSIQKVFRGFVVRKVHRPVLNRRLRGRTKLVAVLVGWKTRKIMRFRKVKNIVFQLKEMMALMGDKSKGANANDLFSMINQQVPVLKNKLKAEFARLYRTGKWAEPWRIGTKESPQAPGKPEELGETAQSAEPATSVPPRNRDEVPVNSLKGDYSSMTDSTAPAKVVHTVGFFKRTETRQPRTSEANEKEEGRERSPHSERAEDQPGDMEEERQEDDRPPQPFLKRRSQAVVAQKLKWKTQHRIDCWGGQAKPIPKPSAPKPAKKPLSKPLKSLPKKAPAPPRPQPFDLGGIILSPLRSSGKQGEGQPIEQLEQAFQAIEHAHVYVSGYFQRPQTATRVPQFLPDSYFVTHYTEEIYAVSARQETLETLESHYNSLCSEAAEANKD